MNNANYAFREPKNEPVYSYAPGTPERKLLQDELDRQYNQVIEICPIIGGKEIKTGDMGKVVMPTEHAHVLANYHKVGKKEVQMAIDAGVDILLLTSDATETIMQSKSIVLPRKNYNYNENRINSN